MNSHVAPALRAPTPFARHLPDLAAIALVFVVYMVTIRVALDADVATTLLGALANTLPVIVLGLLVRNLVIHRLVGRPLLMQIGVHVGLCVMFCLAAYWFVLVLLGLFVGHQPDGYLIRPFNKSALAWQSLENVTTYALLAALAHLQSMRRSLDALRSAHPTPTPPEGAEPEAKPSRHFVRIGDEWRPLDWETVVCIGGADDYAEVRTTEGTHLVRVTLAEFERTLDPTRYVRVHRSWLVDIQRVTRVEPAGGGCLLLHMAVGPAVKTSREGAKRVRDRVI